MMNSPTVTRRQFLHLVGGVSASALVLAACAPSPAGAPGAASEGAAEVAGAATTITHWDFGGGEFEYIDSVMIPEFQESHSDVAIEHVGIPEDGYTTKVKASVSAGAQPDVAVCFDNTWWKAGLCMALDDMLEAQGINWREDYFLPVLELHCIIDDGKLYGMPVLAHINAAMINLDQLERAGVEPWDATLAYDHSKWYELARAVNVPSDDMAQRVWGTDLLEPKWSSIKHGQAMPKWSGDDGRTAVGNIDSPEWVQMYQFMYQIWQEELMPIGDVAQGLGAEPFMLGQMGFSDVGSRSSYQEALDQGINVRMVQKPCIGPEKGTTGFGGWTSPWTVFKAAKNLDASLDWVYFLGTDGAITFAKSEGYGEPPCLKKLAADHTTWAPSEEDAEAVLYILEHLPNIPFTPNFRPLVEPMLVAWTRITEENVPVETAVQEGAAEVQDLLDDAWEQWDALTG